MAFPVPSHLPRKNESYDVSTTILTKISDTPLKSLNAELASSWVSELDGSIQQTKGRIHKRITTDLPSFDRQLSTAKSVQARLLSLKTNVDKLSETLSNPETGLVPTVLRSLTQHAALKQETTDADIHSATMSHILTCRTRLNSLSLLVGEGRLPDAVSACQDLHIILEETPTPLSESELWADVKRHFRATKDRIEEQLNDAYARSIVISPSEIVIRPSIQVRQSQTVLSLPSVLGSLSQASLTAQFATLRRDLVTFYIDHVLQQPASIMIVSALDPAGTPQHRLTIISSPPNSEHLSSRLDNIDAIVNFLNTHLFPHLPPSQKSLPNSLCKPLTSALLNHLLIPSLPSSKELLPSFLEVVETAVKLEDRIIYNILGEKSNERNVKTWADGVALHYERKRREDILQYARTVVLQSVTENETSRVQLDIAPELEDASTLSPQSKPEPVKEEYVWGFDEPSAVVDPAVIPVDEDAWGFEDEKSIASSKGSTNAPEENGWDFDDEIPEEPEAGSVANSPSTLPPHTEPIEEDPIDAWGWNDDSSSLTIDDEEIPEDPPWDDAWDEKPVVSPMVPKPANRLEKLPPKKGVIASPSVLSPALIGPPPPTPVVPQQLKSKPVAIIVPPVIKESYVISAHSKKLIKLVEDVLREGAELASSGILSAYASSSSSPGTLILQSAPLTLDLFRALYPVTGAALLNQSPDWSMRFSNDCLYLAGEIRRVTTAARIVTSGKAQLDESRERLKLLGDSWFEENIERQTQFVNETLDVAAGFVDTSDQDRFDECESAVNQILQDIRRVSSRWKAVLNKSKYYTAIGSLVDAALARILQDILALPDIPEVESHRLSELCRILTALEGLFVENPQQPSFVVSYVPSWLKFSYLSELLEASIADISYLFEEGALVDFEIEELVKLVRALFADTPLRANTMNKLLQGHPAHW